MGSHRVADADVNTTDQGIEATVSYYVLDADRATYIPARYSTPYDPDTGGTWLKSRYQNKKILVKDVNETPLSSGNSYIVEIIANNFVDNADGSDADSLLDDVVWEYPQGELLFDPKWYGIRKVISGEDAWKFFGTFNALAASTSPSLSIGLYGMYRRFLKYDSTEASIDSQSGPGTPANLARQGDLIYRNAIPAIYYEQSKDSDGKPIESGADTGYDATSLANNTRGTADYKDSPFVTAVQTPDVNWVGQKIPMTTGTIVFYVRQRQSEVALFQGVNGDAGFTSRCRPFDFTTGKWRAKSQHIKEIVDAEGDDWLRITRSMEYAPGTLLWSADKNGGTWSW